MQQQYKNKRQKKKKKQILTHELKAQIQNKRKMVENNILLQKEVDIANANLDKAILDHEKREK
jgi:hypothetical protein